MGCTKVAIPLGQGQVFNPPQQTTHGGADVAIPLGQGQVFNSCFFLFPTGEFVAIPLGQGQVFNSQGCFFSLFSMCCRGRFQLLFL